MVCRVVDIDWRRNRVEVGAQRCLESRRHRVERRVGHEALQGEVGRLLSVLVLGAAAQLSEGVLELGARLWESARLQILTLAVLTELEVRSSNSILAKASNVCEGMLWVRRQSARVSVVSKGANGTTHLTQYRGPP